MTGTRIQNRFQKTSEAKKPDVESTMKKKGKLDSEMIPKRVGEILQQQLQQQHTLIDFY